VYRQGVGWIGARFRHGTHLEVAASPQRMINCKAARAEKVRRHVPKFRASQPLIRPSVRAVERKCGPAARRRAEGRVRRCRALRLRLRSKTRLPEGSDPPASTNQWFTGRVGKVDRSEVGR